MSPGGVPAGAVGVAALGPGGRSMLPRLLQEACLAMSPSPRSPSSGRFCTFCVCFLGWKVTGDSEERAGTGDAVLSVSLCPSY